MWCSDGLGAPMHYHYHCAPHSFFSYVSVGFRWHGYLPLALHAFITVLRCSHDHICLSREIFLLTFHFFGNGMKVALSFITYINEKKLVEHPFFMWGNINTRTTYQDYNYFLQIDFMTVGVQRWDQ